MVVVGGGGGGRHPAAVQSDEGENIVRAMGWGCMHLI